MRTQWIGLAAIAMCGCGVSVSGEGLFPQPSGDAGPVSAPQASAVASVDGDAGAAAEAGADAFCVDETCAQLGVTCGDVFTSCARTISCGACPKPPVTIYDAGHNAGDAARPVTADAGGSTVDASDAGAPAPVDDAGAVDAGPDAVVFTYAGNGTLCAPGVGCCGDGTGSTAFGCVIPPGATTPVLACCPYPLGYIPSTGETCTPMVAVGVCQ